MWLEISDCFLLKDIRTCDKDIEMEAQLEWKLKKINRFCALLLLLLVYLVFYKVSAVEGWSEQSKSCLKQLWFLTVDAY